MAFKPVSKEGRVSGLSHGMLQKQVGETYFNSLSGYLNPKKAAELISSVLDLNRQYEKGSMAADKWASETKKAIDRAVGKKGKETSNAISISIFSLLMPRKKKGKGGIAKSVMGALKSIFG